MHETNKLYKLLHTAFQYKNASSTFYATYLEFRVFFLQIGRQSSISLSDKRDKSTNNPTLIFNQYLDLKLVSH
jgi:hypothetical protein